MSYMPYPTGQTYQKKKTEDSSGSTYIILSCMFGGAYCASLGYKCGDGKNVAGAVMGGIIGFVTGPIITPFIILETIMNANPKDAK